MAELTHEDEITNSHILKIKNVPAWKSFTLIHPKDVLVKVKIHISEIKSDSGIILTTKPSVLTDREQFGEVVAIGKEVSQVNISNIVYFDLTSGVDLFIWPKEDDSKEDYKAMLISEDKLLGVIDE